MEQIGDVVVATRGGVPVRVKDIAEVKIGRELRTGSASENGEEAVTLDEKSIAMNIQYLGQVRSAPV